MTFRTFALAAALASLPVLAFAQAAHQGHAMPAARASETAATKGYREANAKMHQAMNIPFSNDADADFVRSMIAHHQGAIDMAKVALQHAQDEQVRRWATDVVREQEREIGEMQAWLKQHGAQ